ncbi:hypothetical protein VH15_05880 [Corynebacterium ulcerans]|nr:hypothetical protein VH15_05880 [Corynebacterium ulcerans]
MSNKLLTTAAVAKILGLPHSTVTWRARTGRLTPAMKLPGINGAYLFDPREIEQLASKKGPAK